MTKPSNLHPIENLENALHDAAQAYAATEGSIFQPSVDDVILTLQAMIDGALEEVNRDA